MIKNMHNLRTTESKNQYMLPGLIYLLSGMFASIFGFLLFHVPLMTLSNKVTTAALSSIILLLVYINFKSKLSSLKYLRESEEHYRNLVEIAPLAIIVHQNGKIVYANPMAEKLTGADSYNELIGMAELDLIHPEDRSDETERISRVLKGEKLNNIEKKLLTLDGRTIIAEASTLSVKHHGAPAVMCLFKDITERKITENKLKEAESRYRCLVESTLVGVFLYQDNKLIYANPYLENILGYTTEEMNQKGFLTMVYPEDISGIENSYNSGKDSFSFRAIRKDGELIFIDLHCTFMSFNGIPTAIGTALDTTLIKKTEEQIKEIAYFDALTGLPNRYMLNKQLNDTFVQADSARSKFAVMFIDLDNFKNINDTLGHTFGDRVLSQAAEKLCCSVRKNDMVSRYGGDEFIIVLCDITYQDCIAIADRIITEFAAPFIMADHEIYISPSVGISFYPEDGDNLESLIKNADAAMYLAKENGKNNYQFFTSSLNKVLLRKLEIENGLRKALKNNEFYLHYQPQVELETGDVYGLEALIRWQHPTLGIIPPSEFIPIAEETGLINPIGEWVLETACKQNKLWQDSGFSKLPVAVNVSAFQLQHTNFTELVRQALLQTELDPRYLVIEFTESIMQDTAKSSRIVNRLKALGVRVAIDDFGTGYSSLSLLKNLDIDILKIDAAFVKDISTSPNTLPIIKLIIDMGNHLDFDVIVEGIETEQQARIIKGNNCKFGQGYFFSKPQPADLIKTYLSDYQFL